MPLEQSTQTQINDAFKAWRARVIDAMARRALEAHMVGDLQAHKTLRLKPSDMKVVQTSALEFSKDYRARLEKDGSTIINGKPTPWLKRLERSQREEVGRIIEEGIEKGQSTGSKQTGKGTYPKGSIAEELNRFFSDRKSHASMVARTEVGRIQNLSRINRYDNLGYTKVRVLDNEGLNSCKACKKANGQIWSLKKAQINELEHPNCVRTFVPVKSSNKALGFKWTLPIWEWTTGNLRRAYLTSL